MFPILFPLLFQIGNYCPIIFVKGEVDRDYRTRGLATTSHRIALSVWAVQYSIVYGIV
jgi:hypothetical protein